jgi:hypothetical protein
VELTCPKCGATHSVDAPSGVRRALRFRCTACGHGFTVQAAPSDGLPVAVGAPAVPRPAAPVALPAFVDVRPDAILSVLAGADTWAVDAPETLLAWILEGRVLPEDVGLDASGRRTVLAARPALAPFFAAARVLEDVRAGRLVPAVAASAPAEPAGTPAALPVAKVPVAEVPVADAPVDDAPIEAIVPPLDLGEDPPTTVMTPDAYAAVASQVGSTPVPLAALLALPRDETQEQAEPGPPPAMALPPLLPSPTEEATASEVTVAVPETVQAVQAPAPEPPAPDAFDWNAPPPPPPTFPWARVLAGGVVVAGVAVALLRGGGDAPQPDARPAASPVVAKGAGAPLPSAPAASAAAKPDAPPPDIVGKVPVQTPVPAPTPAPAAVAAAAAPAPAAVAAAAAPAPAASPAPAAAPARAAEPPPGLSAAPAAPAPASRPRNPAALVKAGWAAVEGGDLGRAKGLFGDAVAAGGGATALHGRGYTLQQLGDVEGAVRDYCAALAANPPGDVRAEVQTFLQRSKRTCGAP